MASEIEKTDFVKLSRENASLHANVLMYGSGFIKVNPDDRKKFSHKKIYETVDMATNMGQTQALEAIYKHLKDISQDTDIPKEQKFAILFGEVELMLKETTTYFFKTYDPKKLTVPHDTITIDDMRTRYLIEESVL